MKLNCIYYSNFYCNIKNRLYNKAKRYLAFTLAEIIIVLLIIGIVASLVMPGLIQNAEDAMLVAAAKKEYSAITNVIDLYNAEHGEDYSKFFDYSKPATYTLNELARYFRILKNCGDQPGCWDEPIKYYSSVDNDNNVSAFYTQGMSGEDYLASAILADGTRIGVVKISTDAYCGYTFVDYVYDSGGNKIYTGKDTDGKDTYMTTVVDDQLCGEIIFDVNGPRGPNQLGIDTFAIRFLPHKMYMSDWWPEGSLYDPIINNKIVR